jgi:peptidoglycan/LPS O-acetylase OafA/YrhL
VDEQGRLDAIDGLRGIAVAAVVLYHAFPAVAPANMALDAGLGPQGVSLFFVLSGFCLAWQPLRRRAAGRPAWFSVKAYAVARCRRILPPYYVALMFYTGLAVAFTRDGVPWIGGGGQGVFSGSAVIAHVFLIHNLQAPWLMAIDGPMWSLATEWQWYFFFPAMLGLCCSHPRKTLVATFIAALTMPHLLQVDPGWHGTEFVPGRLFEFTCGIVAARIRIEDFRVPAWALVTVLLAGLTATTALPVQLYAVNLYLPLLAVSFGSLILLALQQPVWAKVCSLRFLVWLGSISYSVYLIHAPIVVGASRALHNVAYGSVVSPLVGCALALLASWMFFRVFEAPWLRRIPPVSVQESVLDGKVTGLTTLGS